MLESLFKKIAGLKACNVIKKKPQHRCFPVNIAKFLKLPISKNTCDGLLLTDLMVLCYMGLKVQGLNCIMALGLRVWVTGLVFCFKSASLVLNRVLTCVCKPKTNTFYESIKFLYCLFLGVLDGFRSF